MGLISAVKNWNLDYLFLDEEAIKMSDQMNDRLSAKVRQQYLDGKISEQEQAELIARIEGNTFDNYFMTPENRPTTAFKEGLQEGYVNVTGTIRGTLSEVVATPFRLIPANLWVVLVIGGLIYLGVKYGIFDRTLNRVAQKI